MTERIPPSRTSPTIDPRDTTPYRDLMSAHHALEELLIALKSDGPIRRLMVAEAKAEDLHMWDVFGKIVKRSMDRIAPHIPCKYEGVPQYLCGCPDCTPEPDEGNAP